MMKRKINSILTSAFELGASDIHLTVGVPPVMRINGMLKRYGKEIITPEQTEKMAKAIIPPHLWTKYEDRGEMDFSYGVPGISRFRVNTFCKDLPQRLQSGLFRRVSQQLKNCNCPSF